MIRNIKIVVFSFIFTLLVSQANASFFVLPFFDATGKRYCGGSISGKIDYRLGKGLYDFLHSKINPETCREDDNGVLGSELLKVVDVSTSMGGDLRVAIAIITLLQEYNIAAETWDRGPKYRGNACVSSCAIIFAGAPHRHYVIGINKGSVYPPVSSIFGLHKPEFVVPESTFKNSIEREKRYDELKYELIKLVGNVGVKADFIIKTFETSNSDVFVPLYVDLLMWGVVTSNKPYNPHNNLSPYYK